MDDRQRLLAKLRRIEALHLGATTDGERDATAAAMDRVRRRLSHTEPAEPPVELRFSIENVWSRKLFVALLRRHGLTPYRYPRQRATSIMVRLPRTVADALWREFTDLDAALREHLDAIAEQVIAEAFSDDASEPVEVRDQLAASSRA